MKTKLSFLLILFYSVLVAQKGKNINDEIKTYINNGDVLLIKKECDLNLDKRKDYIFIFEPSKKSIEKEQYRVYIYVFIDTTQGYRFFEGGGIIVPKEPHGSVVEGFQSLEVRDNYFRIKQQSGHAPNLFIFADTKFKYDINKKSIFLDEYIYSTISPNADNDTTKKYSFKDFGIIEFASFELNEIDKIIYERLKNTKKNIKAPQKKNLTYIVDDPDGYSNLRKGKSTSSDILEKVRTGQNVQLIEKSGDWYLVKTKAGNQGYVYKTKIKVE